LAGKWAELLKEVAPGVTRVGVLHEPGQIGQWTMIQAVAQSFGAELKPIGLRDAGEIERAVTSFARSPNGELIVAVSAAALTHRDLIITLAAKPQLSAVYAALDPANLMTGSLPCEVACNAHLYTFPNSL
jgi:putative tryptophan/tyrosine transport system substrate-binding protein